MDDRTSLEDPLRGRIEAMQAALAQANNERRWAECSSRIQSDAMQRALRALATLRSMAQGRSNKEVPSELGISERTVKTHLGHLFQKLGVTSRTEAVRVATHRQLVRMA